MAKQVIDDTKFTGIRLPTSIKPTHYDLCLKPNFTDFTFSGRVKISYQTTPESIKSIVVHSHELKITDGSLEDSSKTVSLNKVTYSPKAETATLEFQDDILPSGTLNLNFTGNLNDKMKGFYRTAFKIDETPVHAATTQFEATDARRCFPCWDEPAIKATFSVTVMIEKYMNVNGKQYERIALSNMPEISRSGSDSELEIKFDKSPIMSTYLLAIIIGPFEALESADTRRPIRVFTTPGKKELGRFALEVACKSLPYYEDYFGVNYPLPKMDLIAIPDFSNGAMENWGLVTYRETCLLFDPANTPTNRKQWIALVVAHELAHQWFGNLVTMEWWTHLWLNEGFASFMEYLCVDHIFPEYHIWSQFLTDCYGRALNLDALNNSHPIEVSVSHPSEIDEIFDEISYEKGASVIRMLYTYIGDDNFRKGMKDYLTKFAYKNAKTEDLWDCLEAASDKPVRKLMAAWTAQKGFPWLSIAHKKDGDKAKLTLTQNKFSADGNVPEEDLASTWLIPISVVTADAKSSQDVCLLEGKSAEISIDNASNGWIKLNPGSIGLYRSAYPDEMIEKLFAAISEKTLSSLDRFGLQSDYYALCQAGKVSTVNLLKLLLAFKNETDYPVWSSIDECLGHLGIILSHSDFSDKLKAFCRQLYDEIYKSLGWTAQPSESHTVAMLRALVIRRLVVSEHKEVIEKSKSLFKTQVDGGAAVPADLRDAVYRAVSVHGDDASYEALFKIYHTTDVQEERCRVLKALASTKDESKLQRVIEFGLSNEVRNQDKIFFIMPMAVCSPNVAWKFLKDNKDMLREKFETGHMMRRIVKCSSENFASEEMAQEIEKFFEENKFPGAERSIKQSLETVRLNAAWLSRDREAMKAFLAQY